MPKDIIFPYGLSLQEGGRISLFPAAEVGFYSKTKKQLTLYLVIDSGATVSALPKSDADVLGVRLEDGIQTAVAGVGNQFVSGWQHNLEISLGRNKFRIPFVFLDTDFAPRVLGRSGIFERFSIIFEERSRRTGLLSYNNTSARWIKKALDSSELSE